MAEVESLIALIGELRVAGEAVGEAVRQRVARAERTVIGDQSDGDEIAAELKTCSDQEVEIQSKLRAVAEQVTTAEVEAAHLGDRREEAASELGRIAGEARRGDPRSRGAARGGGARADRPAADEPAAAPRAARSGQPAGPARVRGGARTPRADGLPARGHRAGDAGARRASSATSTPRSSAPSTRPSPPPRRTSRR